MIFLRKYKVFYINPKRINIYAMKEFDANKYNITIRQYFRNFVFAVSISYTHIGSVSDVYITFNPQSGLSKNIETLILMYNIYRRQNQSLNYYYTINKFVDGGNDIIYETKVAKFTKHDTQGHIYYFISPELIAKLDRITEIESNV